MFKKCNCCEAKLSDNRLVLSLPNALTPVMWMMDMTQEGTFVMRVEQDDNGLFVLQKLSIDGKKIEDIACYADKRMAVDAMTMISKTIHGRKTQDSSSKLSMLLSLLKVIILYGVGLCVLFILITISYSPAKIMINNIFGSKTGIEKVNDVRENNLPALAKDPNAAGVPMSADDFLNNRGNSSLPY